MSTSSDMIPPNAKTLPPQSRMTIRAKGRSFLSLILSPQAPLSLWLSELDEQMRSSKGFFNGKAIILDLSLLSEETENLSSLQEDLRTRGFFIIAVEGGDKNWSALADWDMPIGPSSGREVDSVSIPHSKEENLVPPPKNTTLIIDRAVRSGQSIQNPEGDIVVLGSVSSGAEIIAGGSIHIYGTLRGRAIAGLDGRSLARIYTMKLEAELLALDGFYIIAEEISDTVFGRSAQIMLQEEKLSILPLSLPSA